MATMLSNAAASLIPRTVSGPIFEKATESSAVMSLARRVPLAITAQTEIPVLMDIPVAGWVDEGGRKPVSEAGVGTKVMKGKKLALIMPVSEEVVRSNPAGLYDQLKQDLPTGLSRAFDHAAIHGKDLRTGGAGPFDASLVDSPNSIPLTTAVASGGIYHDLVSGEADVVNANYDFTGFAADPRLRPVLKDQVDSNGRPIWVGDPTNGFGGGNLIGYPAFYNRGVSGSYRRSGNGSQDVTIDGTPTAGAFTLAAGGNNVSVAYNATANTVETAIQGWGGVFSDVTVTKVSTTWTIAFPTGVSGTAFAVAKNTVKDTNGDELDVTVAATTDKDTGVRAIGGDWSQCAYGVGFDMTMRISNEASYVDSNDVTHSAFQENLVLLLIEAYYGWVVGDPNAFVVYTNS